MSLQRALVYEPRRAIRIEPGGKELPVYLQLAEATVRPKQDVQPQLSLEFGGGPTECGGDSKKPAVAR